MDRGLAGIQVGYNWQIAPLWLVGLESDISASDIETVRDHTVIVFPTGNVTAGANLNWFATLRARFGFAVTPTAFLYLTGGGAYGYTDCSIIPLSGVLTSFAQDKYGWTVGGGLEYALTNSISFKTEYLWLNLGTDSSSSGTALSLSERTMVHTLRAGLNVKLGPWGAY